MLLFSFIACDVTGKVHNEPIHSMKQYGVFLFFFLNHFRFAWPFTFMPGANCIIFGCSTSRRHCEISIFKIPSGEAMGEPNHARE